MLFHVSVVLGTRWQPKQYLIVSEKTGITETGIPATEPALDEDDTLYASEVSSDVFKAASVVEENIVCFKELDEDWQADVLNPPFEEEDEDSGDDDTPVVLKSSHEEALKAVGVLQEYFFKWGPASDQLSVE